MAEWWVKFFEDHVFVGDYMLQHPEVEVRNSEPGGFSGELALGQKRRSNENLGITRDQFAPYRTQYEVWRHSVGSGVCVSDGFLTSVNLNKDRDTVLINGQDWKHYLQRRVYPFTPEDYIEFDDGASWMFWDKWPKRWPGREFATDPVPPPIPVARIVRDLLFSMKHGVPVDYLTEEFERIAITTPSLAGASVASMGVPDIVWNIDITEGALINQYKIYPGDETSIYDHIDKLSEMQDGFEWDILPQSREFKLWVPTKYPNNYEPLYWFRVIDDPANTSQGQIVEMDWTNEGPDGTWLTGLGSGRHKMGATWTYQPSLEQFGRFDLVYDYGEVRDYDMILQKLKDQNDLHPQKKLALTILNPEFTTPNFYTGGRPRAIIANTVRVTRNFAPYHTVDAYFKVNAIKWNVDDSSNESVELELMMIYESGGTSGGI